MSSLIIEFFIENYIIRNGTGDIYLISLSLPSFAIVFHDLRNEETTCSHSGPGPWRYLVGGSDQCVFFPLLRDEKLHPSFKGFLFPLLPSCYDILIPVTRGCYLVSRIFLYWCLKLNDLMWINNDRNNLWRS